MFLDLSPLVRYRDFRLLFIGQLVSVFGSMMTYVALPYQLYHLTGSSLAVGMIGVVQLVPLLFTALIGGAYADAVDRRKLLVVAEISLAGVEMVSYMSGPLLGNAESGIAAALANTQVSIISGGVLCVLGVLICAMRLPRFWSYDHS